MKRRMRAVLIACLGAGLSCLPHAAVAQAIYGSVYGTVTDSSGAAIPGATVTVTDDNKGTSRTVQTNESGGYTLEHMIPDYYSIKVEMTGFKTFETHHLQVLADTSPKVDAALEAGGASETVNVNADAIPQLKTDRADVAQIFDQKQVADLPIQGRNFTALELLLPGAQQLGWTHAADENPQSSQQIQIDGQAFGGVAYELDGTDNQDPILGIIVINPAIDAITESKLATQNYDAEFGKAVAAVVTVQTRSGTNNFHGSAFDYRTSNANLARNPFAQQPNTPFPSGLSNEFGGSIGGPIKKDRAFFFGDYQGQRKKFGTAGQQTVPSALLMETCLGNKVGPSGIPGCDFSEYQAALGANGIVYDTTGATPVAFPGNVIPTAMISQPAKNFFKLLEPYAPNTQGQLAGLKNNYAASGTGLLNADQWDVRGDVQVSTNIHAFGRFSRYTDTLSGASMFGPAGGTGFGLNNYGGTSKGANDSVAAGADIAVNPGLLTDFRLGYYRYNIITSKNDQNVPLATQLGIPNLNLANSFTGGSPAFNLADVGQSDPSKNGSGAGPQYGAGLNVDRCNCPLSQREDQFQGVNNWTKIFGNHSMKFGADIRYARNLRVPSDNNRTGILSFANGPTSNGAGTGGLGFATFMLGDVTQLVRYASTSTNAKEFQKRVFFYGQDTWRATPKLVVNAGLRWELYFPETVNGQGNGSLMDMSTGYLSVAGYGNIPSNMGWDIAWKALAPRIGVAYQLNPKTVIRAGYGRSFDMGVFGSIFGHTATQNLPVLTNQSMTGTTGPTSYAFQLQNGPGLPPVTAVPNNGLLANPGYSVTSKARPNPLRMPTIDAWNLSIQRSLTPTLSVTMAYVGNKGTHTLSAGDGNSTNPNEAAIFLPAAYSQNGQTLHYDNLAGNGISANNGTANATLLQRYYAGTLAACQDPNYIAAAAATGANIPVPGACGWTQSIQYNGDDQDTHYNALQISVEKQLTHGLSFTSQFAWQRSINFQSGYATWNKQAAKGRDDSTREEQEVLYGTYLLPFGRNQRFASNVPAFVDEIIGGWQISPVFTYASGLPFTVSYGECGTAVPSSVPCYVNGDSRNLPLHISKLDPVAHHRFAFAGIDPSAPGNPTLLTQSIYNFSAPGLDQIGTAGRNGRFGPNYLNLDASLQKNFPIHESLFAQFRVDAFNATNHMSLSNPSGNIDQGTQYINSLAFSNYPTRQLQFSLRVQF